MGNSEEWPIRFRNCGCGKVTCSVKQFEAMTFNEQTEHVAAVSNCACKGRTSPSKAKPKTAASSPKANGKKSKPRGEGSGSKNKRKPGLL